MFEPENVGTNYLDISGNRFQTIDRKHVHVKDRRYWIGRRTQDIFYSLLGLVVLWPFFLLVALVIYIDDSHDSPIFTQSRIGRDGKPFKLYKFRCMYVDAEDRLAGLMEQNEMDGPVFKIKNNPRITRIGRLIRRCSIDEFPQLIDILKGDMSIVSPRPELPREVE